MSKHIFTAPTADQQRQETKEQCHRRLLTDLYAAEQLYSASRRAQEWELASRLAQETARIARLIDLNERGGE